MNSELLTRAAKFEPTTFNAEKNTIEMVFSTGADVMRSDFEGPFAERLDMSPEAVDLSEFRGAPLLDAHDRFSGVKAILGVVEAAAVDGTRGTATVRFGVRPEIAGLVADVRSGIIRNVSAGYSVSQWTISKRADGVRIKTASKWKPREVSLVALGADPAAQVRNYQGETMELQTQIRSIAEAVGLPATFADGLAERSGITIDQARAEIIAEAAKTHKGIDTRPPKVEVTRDEVEGLSARMAGGLKARIDYSYKPTDGEREFASMSFSDYARRCLQARGLSTLGNKNQLIERALMTTSDFPNVLAEYFNKELLTVGTSASPITQVFRRTTMSDFRARHYMEISEGPALEKVNEKGEIHFGKITDNELSAYAIDTYAKGFGVSYKLLVNDDLGALADLAGKASGGARRWLVSKLVDTIVSNPVLADNVAVFHATHGNLAASGAVPSETTLSAAKLGMRLQTDMSGNPVGAAPKFMLFPAALEAGVDRLMATLYPVQPDDAQVSGRNLTPIVEPRLDLTSNAAAWYLFASPSEAPVFEFAELEGMSGPQVQTQEGFTTLGVQVRVVWHVGFGAIDSRGGYKNPGV